MRKLVFLLPLAIIVYFACSREAEKKRFPEHRGESAVQEEPVTDALVSDDPEWDRFISAVIWKESRGDENAVGDGGKAVGVLQIHPIMVREANRILALEDASKANYFSYGDRYSRDKSIEIFKIVQGYHNKRKDYKKALQIWNHGHPASYYNDIMWKFNQLG